jgi:hypothetical protein
MATNNSTNYQPTNHGVVIGAANGGISSTAVGLTGQLLQGNTGADPTYSTAVYPTVAGTTGNFVKSDGTNFVSAAQPVNAFVTANNGTNVSPANSTTYFMSNDSVWNTTLTAAQEFVVPVACTITSVYGAVSIAGTLGTSENVTFSIRVNNTTDTTVSSTWQWTANPSTVNNTGLSISLNAGDYFSFKVVTPAWATKPTTCNFTATVYLT